jgi:transcription factor C subunit 7
MVSTIYVTRHGFRSNWLTDVAVPEPPTGIEGDSVLSEHGLDQAKELAEYLAQIPHVERIYSSPFYRCLQTSVAVAQRLGIEIYTENGVGEWYKRTRPTKPVPASAKTLKGYFPELNEDYVPLLVVSPDGETEDELHDRCKEVITNLVASLKSSPIDRLLIVTHAATKIALGRALVGDRGLEVRTGTCSLDKYVLPEGNSGQPGDWVVEFHGKTDFLWDGEEMHWSFHNAYDPGSSEDALARRDSHSAGPTSDSHMDVDQEEMATVYVPLDMALAPPIAPSIKPGNIPPESSFQMVELETDKPLFKVGDNVYQGNWQDVVGTEIYTLTDGEVFATSRTRVVLEPVTIKNRAEVEQKAKAGLHAPKTLAEKIRAINERNKLQAARQPTNGDGQNGVNVSS